MTLLHAKQIERVISAPILITSFNHAASANFADVDAAIASALAGAGNNGVAVPDQISADLSTEGVIVSGNFNRVEIYDATTQDKIQHSSGAEVYGRIIDSSGDYQLRFYYSDAVNGGTETAYVLPAQTIDFSCNYRFSFEHLPSEALMGMRAIRSMQDAQGVGRRMAQELLTVTAQNTISDLTSGPVDPGVKLYINGDVAHVRAGDFTMAGNSITWLPASAGYNVETTDTVVAEYAVNS